ncbi:MAG: ATP-binding protein [Candidatus Faecivicinus sp.]
MLYAIYRFEDGAFLLFSSKETSAATVLANRRGIILIILLLMLAVAAFVVAWLAISAKEQLVNRVMNTLDQFSDGNFDARIEPLPGKDETVAEYNAIIARIQSRIFQQRSRNHALSVVMTQMQNGIIAVDQDLRVILVTPVAKKWLGIVGNPEGMPVSEASKDVRLDEAFLEAMQQCGVYTNDVAARTAVGRGHRPLRLYVSPMRNDGKVVGALAMVEDITEMRRLEQARTDFAANVSHELKTPLTSIRGFVETLEAGAIDNPPMAHKFLRIIMLETERLTRLINDILSISKLESGQDEVAIERIRLDKMAYDVSDMLMIHASEKQVTINVHLNEKPTYIMGNPDRVEQMLINLIENAIKYNKPGGSVTVQVFSNEQEANVTISDTGIGIAEEHLPRMFERFYRVDKGRSRQMGGTGLGLAIVKHIVRSMNGEIEVHSKLGEGTEFLITLPLAPKEAPEKDTIFDDM